MKTLSAYDPFTAADLKEQVEWLIQSMDGNSEMVRDMFIEELDDGEVAKKFKYSQERVSQLRRIYSRRIRSLMGEHSKVLN